jgi:hypothetical protein
MLTTPIRLVLLAFLAAALAACGGGGSGGGGGSASGGGGATSGGNEPTGNGDVNGISIANCLNEDENFLVQPSDNALDGQSPGGVVFTLTFYKDEAAAKAAAAKKGKKSTAVVENGVVDFRGNPTIFEGAPPAKVSQTELQAIKRCIDKAKG